MKRRELAERLIYGHELAGRFTQDSPVLPDVWIGYAEKPGERQDLLLTPYIEGAGGSSNAGLLMCQVRDRLGKESKMPAWKKRHPGTPKPVSRLAYNQSTVAASLTFPEMVRVILPLSRWWTDRVFRNGRDRLVELLGDEADRRRLAEALASGRGSAVRLREDEDLSWVTLDVLWMVRVIGVLSRASARPTRRGRGARAVDEVSEDVWPGDLLDEGVTPDEPAGRRRRRIAFFEALVSEVSDLLSDLVPTPDDMVGIYSVSRNRLASATVWRSRAAVKADAATRVFEVSCESLNWAVIDSGIDARHPAFRRRYQRRVGNETREVPMPLPAGVAEKVTDSEEAPDHAEWVAENRGGTQESDWTERSRIVATYDFTLIRYLLMPEEDEAEIPAAVRERLARIRARLKRRGMDDFEVELRRGLRSGRELDWAILEPFLRVAHDQEYEPPKHEHGTHVAGILGGDWRKADGEERFPAARDVSGMCPDINLYDLRVLNDAGVGDEFSVMAALQFVRSRNAHKDYQEVHGVNLSLSIPHDVANYACGRTPVCEECERLVGAGIVVVAAAGNEGYLQYITAKGLTEGYRSISITDPGNAENVITVGSTHRDQPHTYGVSYFSSRGPTGDGRAKPDLVAPGEKIESTVPSREVKRKDGTSMAAPHVSGAAALLIARHRELAGQPRRIKEILCKSATDLRREPYFQGAGMLDVLRAIQSV